MQSLLGHGVADETDLLVPRFYIEGGGLLSSIGRGVVGPSPPNATSIANFWPSGGARC